MGFETVGRLVRSYRLAGAADFDAHACATYGANLPVTPLNIDLNNGTSSRKRFSAMIDSFSMRDGNRLVLVGGPPCQGFSAHGKKHGDLRLDPRNELIAAFTRAALLLRPDFVVMENVPEILSKKHWQRFVHFRNSLERAGYIVRAQIHNLAGFGVPQERFRALIVAARTPFSMPEPFLDGPQYLTVRDAIGGLLPVSPGDIAGDDPMHYCTRHRDSTIDTIRHVALDGGSRPRGVGPKCLDKVDGFRDVYGRLYWDRPSNTITASSRNPASGRYSHPVQHRGLTIREAALLQAFPPTFSFKGPFDDRFQQIGNAVPPAFAAFLAAHLLGEILSEDVPRLQDLTHDITAPTSNSYSSGIAGRKKPRSVAR